MGDLADVRRIVAAGVRRAIGHWHPRARARIQARNAWRVGFDVELDRNVRWVVGEARVERRWKVARAPLRFNSGGPGPLTEDRQKPRCRLDGMHGTRNTVPSIAVMKAKPCTPFGRGRPPNPSR